LHSTVRTISIAAGDGRASLLVGLSRRLHVDVGTGTTRSGVDQAGLPGKTKVQWGIFRGFRTMRISKRTPELTLVHFLVHRQRQASGHNAAIP
jgi:hypothetical protein